MRSALPITPSHLAALALVAIVSGCSSSFEGGPEACKPCTSDEKVVVEGVLQECLAGSATEDCAKRATCTGEFDLFLGGEPFLLTVEENGSCDEFDPDSGDDTGPPDTEVLDTDVVVDTDTDVVVDTDTDVVVDTDTDLVDTDTDVVDTDTDLPPDTDTDLPPDTDTDLPPDTDTDLPPDTDTDLPPDTDTDLPPDTDTDLPPDTDLPDTDLPPDTDTDLPPDTDTDLPPDTDTAVVCPSDTFEIDDSMAVVVDVSSGSAVLARTLPPGDLDLMQAELPAGCTITFTWAGSPTPTGALWAVTVGEYGIDPLVGSGSLDGSVGVQVGGAATSSNVVLAVQSGGSDTAFADTFVSAPECVTYSVNVELDCPPPDTDTGLPPDTFVTDTFDTFVGSDTTDTGTASCPADAFEDDFSGLAPRLELIDGVGSVDRTLPYGDLDQVGFEVPAGCSLSVSWVSSGPSSAVLSVYQGTSVDSGELGLTLPLDERPGVEFPPPGLDVPVVLAISRSGPEADPDVCIEYRLSVFLDCSGGDTFDTFNSDTFVGSDTSDTGTLVCPGDSFEDDSSGPAPVLDLSSGAGSVSRSLAVGDLDQVGLQLPGGCFVSVDWRSSAPSSTQVSFYVGSSVDSGIPLDRVPLDAVPGVTFTTPPPGIPLVLAFERSGPEGDPGTCLFYEAAISVDCSVDTADTFVGGDTFDTGDACPPDVTEDFGGVYPLALVEGPSPSSVALSLPSGDLDVLSLDVPAGCVVEGGFFPDVGFPDAGWQLVLDDGSNEGAGTFVDAGSFNRSFTYVNGDIAGSASLKLSVSGRPEPGTCLRVVVGATLRCSSDTDVVDTDPPTCPDVSELSEGPDSSTSLPPGPSVLDYPSRSLEAGDVDSFSVFLLPGCTLFPLWRPLTPDAGLATYRISRGSTVLEEGSFASGSTINPVDGDPFGSPDQTTVSFLAGSDTTCLPYDARFVVVCEPVGPFPF